MRGDVRKQRFEEYGDSYSSKPGVRLRISLSARDRTAEVDWTGLCQQVKDNWGGLDELRMIDRVRLRSLGDKMALANPHNTRHGKQTV